MKMRLALGTAQFGLSYGVANARGQIKPQEANLILDEARKTGISTLDTAIGYGDSEAVLGQLGVADLRVVTKLPACPTDTANIEQWVISQVRSSIDRLRITKLYGILLHRPEQLHLNHGGALFNAILKLQRIGLVQKIGVSVYSPEELEILFRDFEFQLVQVPLNILDRRFLDNGWIDKIKARGIEVHARSAFLQGLLLMEDTARPAYFLHWNDFWAEWRRWLADEALTPLQACLRYVASIENVDKIIVGVDNADHLRQICAEMGGSLQSLPVWPRQPDEALIDPSKWSQN